MSTDDLIAFAHNLTREDFIEWLTWNDSNGVYTDEQSLKEFEKVMQRNERLEIFLRQVEENRVV